MSAIDISFDEDDRSQVPDNRAPIYKAEKGRIDVISIVLFRTIDDAMLKAAKTKNPKITDEELETLRLKFLAAEAKKRGKSEISMIERCGDFSSPRFQMCNLYFSDNPKVYAVRDSRCDSPEDDMVWNRVSDPQTKLSTVIIRYPTTSDGEVDTATAQQKYKVQIWRGGPNLYKELIKMDLSAKKDDSRLGWKDIQVACKDSSFQNNSYQMFGKATWRTWPVALQEKILREAHKMASSRDFLPAKVQTTDEIRKILGIRPSVATSYDASSVHSSGGGDDSSSGDGDDDSEILAGLLCLSSGLTRPSRDSVGQSMTMRPGALQGFWPLVYGPLPPPTSSLFGT